MRVPDELRGAVQAILAGCNGCEVLQAAGEQHRIELALLRQRQPLAQGRPRLLEIAMRDEIAREITERMPEHSRAPGGARERYDFARLRDRIVELSLRE